MNKKLHTTYRFSATLDSLTSTDSYRCIYIPLDITEQLGHKSRTRVHITLNGKTFNLAIQNQKTGERYVMVSNAVRKQANLIDGAPMEVSLKLADPDELELPQELEAVLEQDPETKVIWESFTIGRRRSLAHYVNSVKNIDSRIKRSLELMDKAKRGELYIQQAGKK